MSLVLVRTVRLGALAHAANAAVLSSAGAAVSRLIPLLLCAAGRVVACAAGYAAVLATFHVDPSLGDDRRDGRQEATAFRSLERARQAGDASIDAMSGDIVFGAEDVGPSAYRLHFGMSW